MTHAGQMDAEITVEIRSTSKDSAGLNTDVITWVPLVALPGSPVIAERFFAQVSDAVPSRSDSVKQGLSVARDQVRIRLRYRSDMDSSMRITVHRDHDEIYRIVGGPAIVQEGRKRFTEVVCEKFSTRGYGG